MASAPTVPPQLPTQLNCPFSNDVLEAQSLRRQIAQSNQQTAEEARPWIGALLTQHKCQTLGSYDGARPGDWIAANGVLQRVHIPKQLLM